MLRSRTSRALVAPLVALALVAAACGGDDDSADDPDTEEPVEEPVEEPADTGEEPVAEPADDGEEPTEEPVAEPADDGEEPTEEPVEEPVEEPAEEMTPQRGGTLTYLLEAESDTWDIPGANCAVACITVMRQVMDPLTIVNADGEVEPFLLEAYEPNEDFTEYTLTMREGVTFHDGTPADGAAVQRSLTEMANGILQGQVFWDLANGSLFSTPTGTPADSIELVDPMTVKVSFARPNALFGYSIAERTGWLIAPSFWDNPDRAGALPVGTGPFQMTEWTRGERTVLEANPSYWRTDHNGEALPYLDSIVFRPIPDVAARRATMEAGDADANQDSFGENKEFWNGAWLESGGQIVEPAPDRETTYLMFNNSVPPFDNADMRRALALCTDRDEYIAFRSPGATLANGPFSAGSLGHLEDPGFPQFNPDEGNALLDEIGRPAEIVYGTTNDPSNLLTAELFADMWSTNCGLTVTIDQFDQSELITKALTGGFQVFLWRNHGQGNPGLETVWWHSRHAAGLALNFGRIVDPELDALLEQTWGTTDLGELDEIGQQINQRFAENVYNLWLNETEWANVYQGNVHGVGVMHLPSGNLGQTAIAGRTWLHEAWKEG